MVEKLTQGPSIWDWKKTIQKNIRFMHHNLLRHPVYVLLISKYSSFIIIMIPHIHFCINLTTNPQLKTGVVNGHAALWNAVLKRYSGTLIWKALLERCCRVLFLNTILKLKAEPFRFGYLVIRLTSILEQYYVIWCLKHKFPWRI